MLCGWDITQVFQEAQRREQFAAVYHDIVLCLPSKNIWKESCGAIIDKSLEDAQVLNLLVDVLSVVAGSQIYRPESAEWDGFTEILLPKLKRFVQSIQPSGVDLQRQRTTLQALLHVVAIYDGCSKNLKEILRIGPVPDICDKVVNLLNCRDTSYLVKADTLNVLAQFNRSTGVSGNSEESALLIGTLERFIAEEFPIVSADVKFGTKEYDVYNLLFRQLLLIIEESRSVAFLKLLFPSLKEGSRHLFTSDLAQGLSSFTDKLSSNTEAADLLELVDVLLDASVDVTIRKTLLETVFTPLMELKSAESMKAFFLAETGSSKAIMVSKLSTLIANSAEIGSPGGFFSTAVAFALVEILFRLAEPEFIRNEINAAFLGHANGKGREFTMLICKCASKVVTKAYGEVSETVRFACCEAYNCLLTAVSRTQKQEKFFDQILFQEALWSNIIDVSQEHELHAETGQFERVPLSGLSVSTLKTQKQTQDASFKSTQGKLSRDASSALQFFTGSSLSQAATFDTASTQSFADQNAATNRSVYKSVEIELDSVNDHACMVPILRTIMLMKDEFGGSWESKRMPSWMQKIFDVVANSLTELNIRLFLVKIVLNVPDLFGLYASVWLEKIIHTVLEATSSIAPGKTAEFNYLLRDCCQLALGEWKEVSVASMKGAPSRFLATLIELSPHTVDAIMQDNIVLVTQLIILWKEWIAVDTATIETFLFSDAPDARLGAAQRVTSLQLLSAMLTAGAIDEIQVETTSVFGRSIRDGVLLALQHKRAPVYTVAAEVGGMCLQKFPSKADAFLRIISEQVVSAYNEEDFGRFLALLRNVSLHYPESIDAMMLQRLCSLLPKVIAIDAWSRLAIEALENASKNADVVQLIFPSIQAVLSRFITHRDSGVQHATLRVMDGICERLGHSDFELLIKSSSDGGLGLFGHYGSHGDVGCRKLLYSMAMRCFRKSLSSTLKDVLRRALLAGLSDSDSGIREELLAFWNASSLIPSTASQRLVELFQSLYAPELADKWVFYATNLLVLMSKGSEHYDAPLFPSPLTRAEFHDADIDATWEGKSHTMAPLFSVESDAFTSKLASLRDTGSISQRFLATVTQDPLSASRIHHSQLISSTLGT